MAEPVGLAASIVSLVTVAAQLSKLSYRLVSDVKNAPRAQQVLHSEISSVVELLRRAENVHQYAQDAGLILTRPASLSDEAVNTCRSTLEKLRLKLEAGISRAVWFFREDELQKHVTGLQSIHRAFQDFIATNTFFIVTEIYRNRSDNDGHAEREKLV